MLSQFVMTLSSKILMMNIKIETIYNNNLNQNKQYE